MKHVVLIIFTCVLSKLFAQELERNCLLIAIYEVKESGKSWMCRDYTYEVENVTDREEFNLLSNDYRSKYGDLYLSLYFVSSTESSMVYEYQKEINGWNCTKKVISCVVGSTSEVCKEEMNRRYTLNIKDYKTAPNQIYSWTGNGTAVIDPAKTTVNGLKTVMRYGKDASGQEFIVAQFTNTSTDQVALIGMTDDKGVLSLVEVPPGTLTKRFNMKSMQIDVIYKKLEEETLPLEKYLFNKTLETLKLFLIEEGKIGIRTWSKPLACMCVRG